MVDLTAFIVSKYVLDDVLPEIGPGTNAIKAFGVLNGCVVIWFMYANATPARALDRLEGFKIKVNFHGTILKHVEKARTICTLGR